MRADNTDRAASLEIKKYRLVGVSFVTSATERAHAVAAKPGKCGKEWLGAKVAIVIARELDDVYSNVLKRLKMDSL